MGFWGRVFGRIRKALLPACRAVKKIIETTVKYTLKKISVASRAVINYAIENPWEFGFTSILIVGGILVIVVPLAMGFGAGGVAVGSAAAAWQSLIGNVAAGSFFSVLQSLTMTGMVYFIGAAMIVVGLIIPIIGHYWNKWFGGNDENGGG